jgi:hypothetical protein
MTRRKISSPTSSLPVQIHYSDLVHSAAREVKPAIDPRIIEITCPPSLWKAQSLPLHARSPTD